MTTNRLVMLTVALLAGTVLASAQETALPPSVARGTDTTQTKLPVYRFLPVAEHDLYVRALALGKKGNWTGALALADQGHTELARRIVEWSYVTDRDSGARFDVIDGFLKNNADWPSREMIFARAEKAIGPDMTPTAIVAWFGTRTPASSLGRIKLGEALATTGDAAKGRDYIQRGWIEGTFDLDDELAIAARDAQYLSPDANKRRLENLLWRDDIAGAKRQAARVDDVTRKVAQARIALKSGGREAQRALDGLSGDQVNDPTLLYDRARAARAAGNNAQAQSLLLQIPARTLATEHAARWWAVLNVNARQALQDGNAKTAYALVKDTGLTSGTDFADAEFLAGWIALRSLKEPRTALTHFKKLDAGVSRPISKARARYWLGRAYEEQGDLANAFAQFKLASQVSDTFYGQIALARVEAAPTLHISETQVDAAPARADFEKLELVQALRVLADLGEDDALLTFATRVSETNPGAAQQKLLMQMMMDTGFPKVAVRIGKANSYNNVTMLAFTHPVIALPAYRGAGDGPEKALVLGLIRQETEFDANAVSTANAKGIMQINPAYARGFAQKAGLPYRPNALLEPEYSMQLGMVQYGELLQNWNGSLIVAAAAYNAGAGRARQWIAAFGDPRAGADPEDWIEAIPFTETRNYVQRVLENTQVYRNRLAGRDQPLRILADLYAPNAPGMKVLNYKPPVAPAAVPKP